MRGRYLVAFGGVLALAVVLSLAFATRPVVAPGPTPSSVGSASPTVTPAISRGAAFTVARGDGLATVRIREQLVGWTVPDDAILTSDDITGSFGLLDDGTFDPASSLSIALSTIRSDDNRRADAARETMNADRYPRAEFRPLRAVGLPSPLPSSGRWDFRLIGSLRVNGVARELEWDALAERSSGEIKATAKTAFPFGDFAMDPPRRGPVLSLVDEIRLEIEVTARQSGSTSATCTATPQDVPANYRAGAPVRSSIGGGGYVFGGTVRSSPGCVPIGAARVELWLVNPSGTYDDDHRATVVATADGRYRLDTSFPPAYGGGSSHIHIRVIAPGHRELVSIFFPSPGTTSGEMDLVMERL